MLHCQQVGWGYTRNCEGTESGQLTPTGPKNIPCHMMSCSAIKDGGMEEEQGTLAVMAFVL